MKFSFCSKKMLLPFLLLVFLLIGIFLWLYENDITDKTISTMSIVPESATTHNFNDVYNVLVKLKKDEIIMKNYLNKIHLTSNKDKVFEAYYYNLIKGCEFFDSVNYSENYEDNNITSWASGLSKGYSQNFGTDYKSGIHITPIMTRDDYYKDYKIERLEITYPQVPFIEMVYAGEGYFSPEICYKYLYFNYSKYLSHPLRDYIFLKLQEKNDLGGKTYYNDAAITVSKATLMKWIIDWQKYRDKYPKSKSDYINKILNVFTGDFLVSYENSFYMTFDFDNNLLPEAKKDYEMFLEKVNPKTKEYQIVSKCYDVIKENNYKYTKEFRTCVDEWKNKYNSDTWGLIRY